MESDDEIIVEEFDTNEISDMLNRPVQSAESELGQVYYAILDVMGEYE